MDLLGYRVCLKEYDIFRLDDRINPTYYMENKTVDRTLLELQKLKIYIKLNIVE